MNFDKETISEDFFFSSGAGGAGRRGVGRVLTKKKNTKVICLFFGAHALYKISKFLAQVDL